MAQGATDEADGDATAAVPAAKLQGWQEAERRRRHQDAAYLRQHQERLEMVASRCVNQVLLSRPSDPYAAMLAMLDEHTKDGICFGPLRVLLGSAGAVRMEVVASIRGSDMAVHRAELPKALLLRGLAALQQEPAPEDPEAEPALRAAARLRAVVGRAFEGCALFRFAGLFERLCSALPPEVRVAPPPPPTPPAGAAAPAAAPAPPRLSTGTLLRSSVGACLLEATSNLLDCSSLEAIRTSLDLQKLRTAPALHCRADFADWQRQWPELLMPVLQGSTGRRRLFVGLTLWAVSLKEAASREGAAPPELIDKEAAEADPREPGDEPRPHEFCPPLNAVGLLGGLAMAVLEKVKVAAAPPPEAAPPTKGDKKAAAKAKPAGKKGQEEPPPEDPAPQTPAMPSGGDLAASLSCVRKALEELLPQYLAAEQAMPEEDLGGPEAEELQALLQRGSIYCALHADADAAFDAEGGTYALVAGGDGKTQDELVEYYAQLCRAEPLLTALVAPLSPRDPSYADGIAKLRDALPGRVAIILEEGGAGAACDGLVRDLGRTPLGLVAEYEGANQAYMQKDGFYDFDVDPELFAHAASFVDASLALPERRRRLALPKSRNVEEMAGMLSPLAESLRELMVSVYQREHASDGREKRNGLTLRQFQEGLRRTGFADPDRCAAPIFNLLEFRKTGFLCAAELRMLEHIRGPSSWQEVDEFVAWLSSWEKQQRKEEAAMGGGATDGSPIASFWRRLGPVEGEAWTFEAFEQQLQKQMKYPAGLESRSRLLENFSCLDTGSAGRVTEAEFMRIALLSAASRLERVCRVRDFLKERFGSAAAGFRALDEQRSGSLKMEVFAELMDSQHGYHAREDTRATFHFINIHRKPSVNATDFEGLAALDTNAFLDEVVSLSDFLAQKYGSLQAAFSRFTEEAASPLSRASRAPSAAAADAARGLTPAAAPPKQNMEPQDFLSGCRMSGFKGSYDPRYIFNFLDLAGGGKLGVTDFVLLGEMDALGKLEERSSLLHSAIAAVKAFALAADDDQEDAADADGTADPWESLHRRLRAATHHDLFA